MVQLSNGPLRPPEYTPEDKNRFIQEWTEKIMEFNELGPLLVKYDSINSTDKYGELALHVRDLYALVTLVSDTKYDNN